MHYPNETQHMYIECVITGKSFADCDPPLLASYQASTGLCVEQGIFKYRVFVVPNWHFINVTSKTSHITRIAYKFASSHKG